MLRVLGSTAMWAVCVPSLDGWHRALRTLIHSIAVLGFVLALAAIDGGTRSLKAQIAAAEPPRTEAPGWCLQRSETDRPNCIYDSFPSCVLAGFKEGGYCISNPGPTAGATGTAPSEQAQRKRAPRQAAPSQAQSFAAPPQTSQSDAAAATQAAAQPAQSGQTKRRKLTQAEREKIFSDFQTWRAQRADPNTR